MYVLQIIIITIIGGGQFHLYTPKYNMEFICVSIFGF